MTFGELEQIRERYFEKRRKIGRISSVVIWIIALIIVAIAVITRQIFFPEALFSLMPICFFGIIIRFFIVSISTTNELTEYKKAYKAYFVAGTMQKYFTDLHYDHEAGLPKEVLKETGMISTGDIYYSNDFTSGKYHGVPFMQADVEIKDEYTDSDGHTHTVTQFMGRWMVFDFPKKFNFRIAIKGKKGGSILSLSRRARKNARKFERAEIESLEFNKMFKLYAEDGFETFYLLDPAFIAKLEQLGEQTEGKILLCFVDNKLHIGINNYTDSFEPPRPSAPLNEEVETAKVEKDIKLVTQFVDQLKLDQKLFE